MRPPSAALRRVLVLVVLAPLLLALTASLAVAQDSGLDLDDDLEAADVVVEILPLRGGFIDPPVSAQIADVIAQAEAEGSHLVVLQYSSNGGVSLDLDGLLATMEASTVPIAVLLGPLGQGAEARGAAALVWLAADVRAMAPDATVGPVVPADLADPTYPDRDRTAELVAAAGGDAALVEALLDAPVDAASLADAGVASLVVSGLEPLLLELDGRTVVAGGVERELRIRGEELGVRFHSLGLVRRLLHAATTAPFIYLLFVVGLGMLLFELFQPGFGVAGLAGIVTAAIGVFGLTVLPVVWWGVALVVLGLLLYAVDTAVAGLGPITLVATALFAVGSANLYAADALALPWWLIAGTTLTVLVFFTLVMTVILRAQAGPEGVAVEDLVGRVGVVRSVLNPEGHVYIDGALWRARWTGDARRAKVGTPVRVHGLDGPVILVEPFDPEAARAGSATSGTADDGVPGAGATGPRQDGV